MNELTFCQSCGIPLDSKEILGSERDDTKSEEYCIYCYKHGDFTEDVTMDEMIQISLDHLKELFKDDSTFNEMDALNNMKSFFPELKRWRE